MVSISIPGYFSARPQVKEEAQAGREVPDIPRFEGQALVDRHLDSARNESVIYSTGWFSPKSIDGHLASVSKDITCALGAAGKITGLWDKLLGKGPLSMARQQAYEILSAFPLEQVVQYALDAETKARGFAARHKAGDASRSWLIRHNMQVVWQYISHEYGRAREPSTNFK